MHIKRSHDGTLNTILGQHTKKANSDISTCSNAPRICDKPMNAVDGNTEIVQSQCKYPLPRKLHVNSKKGRLPFTRLTLLLDTRRNLSGRCVLLLQASGMKK
mmetsp:Transcript_9507/g.17103  ORF Transcript_9507/g.17103 Transcript_9507/m.17103 type:complete len:102 (+) Transcript_9507:4014-4319(+)